MSEQVGSGVERRSGCALALGLLSLLLAGALLFAWLSFGLSLWSGALALGTLAFALGVLTAGARPALSSRALAASTVLLLGPCLLRIAIVQGDSQTQLTTLPADSGPRLLSRIFPEPDGTLAAAGLLQRRGSLRDPESTRFAEILAQAYARTTPNAAFMPTPAIATYLGQQSPSAFDTIVIRPPERRVAPDGAVVLLHGYAGSFYVYCWEMAQAASGANLLTLCPATGPSGSWWDEDGAEIVRQTLDYAHGIGMNRVYLAGLSNGAAGASVLGHKLQRRLAGLVLVSGGRAETPPALPVLLIQGERDTMMSASHARAYASRGPQVTYRELPGGHFIFLSDTNRVRPLITDFLFELEKKATALPRRQR